MIIIKHHTIVSETSTCTIEKKRAIKSITNEARSNHHQKFVLESIWMHEHQNHPRNLISFDYQCNFPSQLMIDGASIIMCIEVVQVVARSFICLFIAPSMVSSIEWIENNERTTNTIQWQWTCVCLSALSWNINSFTLHSIQSIKHQWNLLDLHSTSFSKRNSKSS